MLVNHLLDVDLPDTVRARDSPHAVGSRGAVQLTHEVESVLWLRFVPVSRAVLMPRDGRPEPGELDLDRLGERAEIRAIDCGGGREKARVGVEPQAGLRVLKMRTKSEGKRGKIEVKVNKSERNRIAPGGRIAWT